MVLQLFRLIHAADPALKAVVARERWWVFNDKGVSRSMIDFGIENPQRDGRRCGMWVCPSMLLLLRRS